MVEGILNMVNLNRICWVLILLIAFFGCIDPIDFDTGEEPRRLVIEGLITNNSYFERQTFPAPAERFYVAVRWTHPVENQKDEVVPDATVELHVSDGTVIQYLWEPEKSHYLIPDDDFGVEPGKEYFIRVILPDGDVYESEPERLHPAPPINSITPEYTSRLKEIQVGIETQFINQRGIALNVNLPEHSDSQPYYYRWKITPSWVFESSLLPSGNPNKTCYVTNRFYFQKINVQNDRSGGYSQELFFLETDDNDRIELDFTALITQYSLSPEGYRFWEELAIQQQSGGGIFDPPPFPLVTNIKNVNDPAEKVSGFFMVAHESVLRWYVNMDELPYNITFTDPCEPVPGIPFLPPPQCLDCREYPGGGDPISNTKPEWWREY